MSRKRTSQEQINQILTLDDLGFSSRKIAKVVLGSSGKKSTVNDILKRYNKSTEVSEEHPNILLFDIESSSQGFLGFSRFNQNFSEVQVTQRSKLLGACAKWLGSDGMIEVWPESFKDWSTDQEQWKMLNKIWQLLDRADYVIAHNAPFDTKMMNAFFIQAGMGKPSPYRVIDTLRIAKQNFRFDSNKLDSLGKFLGVGRKTPHTGFELWRQCMAGESDGFKLMIEYCSQDVLLLEDVYMKIRSWDSRHPNLSIHYDNRHRCGVCASEDLSDTGKKAVTNTYTYDLYVCQDCGAWQRTRNSDKTEKGSAKTLVGVK